MVLRRTHHVIAKSEYMARELAKAFPHLSLHRISNTIDERKVFPLKAPTARWFTIRRP